MTITRYISPGSPSCVLGVMDTERGRKIAADMRRWLLPHYDIHQVLHDGSLYEQPALAYMQKLCIETNRPCLYIHARGACHFWNTTKPSWRMWEREFVDDRDRYLSIVNCKKPVAACPFTGPLKHTWYNGFMANAAAMAAIPPIQPNEDRYVFEDIFRDSPVIVVGTIFDDITPETLPKARGYMLNTYKED